MKQNQEFNRESYPETPLSPSRIKELTMKRITQEKKPRSRVRFRVLLAAAIIAMLAVTAVAAENLRTSQWFQSVLNQELQKEQAYVEENELNYTVQETVSQEQLDILDTLGESFQPQTVTSGGATMTLTAGYGDESVLHLYLQVTAPEGTVLPDGIYYTFFDYNKDIKFDENNKAVWAPVMVKEGGPYDHMSGMTFSPVEALPDEDPTDNKKDFHIYLSCVSPFEQKAYLGKDGVATAFNDGVPKTFNATGLYQQAADVNGDEDGYEPFFTGDFSFDITYSAKLEKTEVDVTGTDYGGHVEEVWSHTEDDDNFVNCGPYDENGLHIHTEEYDYTVTPTYFAISPMGVDYVVKYTCTDDRRSFGLKFKVFMKDGTNPMIAPHGGVMTGMESYATVNFQTPIDLSQVDYILIGEPEDGATHKVYLPNS